MTSRRPGFHGDLERDLLRQLRYSIHAAGLFAEDTWVTNLYVALKSKPLAILFGPAEWDKAKLADCIARALVGQGAPQYQPLLGHAWWADGSGRGAVLTQAQARFNADRVLGLIEEAWAPANWDRLFILCLNRISPAELVGHFGALGPQLRHQRLMRLPGAHLAAPVPYPPNLLLIGTIDADPLHWLETEALAMTNVIRCPGPTQGSKPPPASGNPPDAERGRGFPAYCVRTSQAAQERLISQPAGRGRLSEILLRLEARLDRHQLHLPGWAGEGSLIYLANSWSLDGAGLFSEDPRVQLVTAIDLAVAQNALPALAGPLRASNGLRTALLAELQGLPACADYLRGLVRSRLTPMPRECSAAAN